MSQQEVPYVTDQEITSTILPASYQKPVVFFFTAPWCKACQAFSPFLNQIAVEMNDQVTVVKVNIDENSLFANKQAVRSLPTITVFSNGTMADCKVGVSTKENLKAFIREAV